MGAWDDISEEGLSELGPSWGKDGRKQKADKNKTKDKCGRDMMDAGLEKRAR